MERPLEDVRPIGPVYKQSGGILADRNRGANLDDSFIGKMRVQIQSSTDALDNQERFTRDRKPEILSKGKRIAIDSLNEHLSIYAPRAGYSESNVAIKSRNSTVNRVPLVTDFRLYFWVYKSTKVKYTNQEGSVMNSDGWMFLQERGAKVKNDIKEAFDNDNLIEDVDVSERDTTVKLISSGMLPSDVVI